MAEWWGRDALVETPAGLQAQQQQPWWSADSLIEPAKGFFGRVGAYLTGEGRAEFDLPSLMTAGSEAGLTQGQQLRIAGAYTTSPSEYAVADVVKKAIPKAEISEDRLGNVMVELKGKRFYVNPPGVERTDVLQAVAHGLQFFPAAKMGAAAKTIAGRMARTGPLTAGTSVGQDIIAEQVGSEQGIDYGRAAITGALGAVFELLAPAVAAVWRKIVGNKRFFDFNTGRLTPEGRKVAEKADLDIADWDARMQEAFAREIAKGTPPKGAQAAAEGAEFDIPFTRGQQTGDLNRLQMEELARQGGLGDEAQTLLRQFDDLQGQRIGAAGERIQGGLAGGEKTIVTEAQAGRAVGEGLGTRAEVLGRQVDEAYDLARTKESRFTGTSLSSLLRGIKERIRDFDLDPQLHPTAFRALKNMARLSKDIGRVRGGKTPRSKTSQVDTGLVDEAGQPIMRAVTRQGRALSPIQLRRFEQERRKLNKLIDAATTKADRTATIRIKRELDKWLDDAVDNALFEGDDEALALIKNARSLRREYGAKFEPRSADKEVSRIIRKMVETDPTPEQIVNYVFGRAKLGSKMVSAKIVTHLKEIFGTASPEWAALREMAWLRMTRGAAGELPSAAKMSKTVREALYRDRTLMRALFSQEERNLMFRYAAAVIRTVKPEGARSSRTAENFVKIIRFMLRRAATRQTFQGDPVGAVAFHTAARIPTFFKNLKARKAVTALPKIKGTAPEFVAAGVAAERLRQE